MGIESKGQFCWYDLFTTDVEAAKAFYTELVGWTIEPWDTGAEPYLM